MGEERKKILIIEDEPPLAKILGDTLTREGYEVTIARDGREGVTEVFARWPDLILLDIMMPVMGGITVLKKLQEDARARAVPVMIITNLDNFNLIMEAVEFGPQVAPLAPLARQFEGIRPEEIREYLNERANSGVYEFIVKRDLSLKELVGKVKARLAR